MQGLTINEDSVTLATPTGDFTLSFADIGQINGLVAREVLARENRPQGAA